MVGVRSIVRAWAASLAIAVIVGAHASAASAATHPTLAWGGNGNGQIGNGKEGGSAGTPSEVSGLSHVIALSGGTYHSLGLLSNGIAMAWGNDEFGQLGTTATPSNVPQPVSGLRGVSGISAGVFHSLAVLSNGKVMAWGLNDHGELGDGTSAGPEHCAAAQPCAKVPMEVSGLGGVIAVAAGFDHSLALLANGTVMAWGNDLSGQLGNLSGQSNVPVEVKGLSGVIAIAAGTEFSLALLKDGTIEAWGYNGNGQLGDGKTEQSATPVAVSGLSAVTAISAEGDHSLALLGNGTVQAWGGNFFGQLGDGTTEDKHVPTPVSGLSGASGIAAGGRHSLAVLGNGTVQAWGSDELEQLGDGMTKNNPLPKAVAGVVGATGVAAGGYHSLAFTGPAGRCTSNTGTIRLSPGLSGTPAMQTMKIKGTLGGCTGQPFTQAKYTATLKTASAVSCSVLKEAGAAASGAAKYKWTPKAKSSTGTLGLTLTEMTGAPFSGEITSGSFAPRTLSGYVSESYAGAASCSTKKVKSGTFSGIAFIE
jgi:alpha-tubulin suppressor-like RCC1 family protein